MKKIMQIIFISAWLLAILICSMYFFVAAPVEETYSEDENRMLSGFPDTDMLSIISGDFGEGIEEYLLDNFPKRSYINSKVKSLRSFLSIATYEEYLAIAEGTKDPLDDEVDLGDIDDLLSEENNKPTEGTTEDITEESTGGNIEESTEGVVEKPTEEPTEEPTEPSEYSPIEEKPEVTLEEFKSTYSVYMDTGNGPKAILSYKRDNVAAFTKVLDKYAALLPKDGKLMCTVAMQSIHTNRFVNASSKVSFYGDWDDMVNAYSADNVYAFDTSETLGEAVKRDEYVSFRTDGHWTPYGAYLMYRQMAARAGKDLADYDNDFIHDTWSPFRGIYYRDNQSAYENVTPDNLQLLKPKFSTEVRRITSKDNYKLLDFINYNAKDNDRYTMYLGGPAGPWTYVVSDNAQTENCLVVTDSFGMCYMPFLTTNYKEVHYYDARYYDYDSVGYTVAEMIEKHNIQDIYVIVADFHSFNSSFIIGDANKHLHNE